MPSPRVEHDRIDVRAILADPQLRRELVVGVIVATQAREGIETTREQADRAYDQVQLDDRIDVDGNYEPTNCRWATPKEQTHNRRVA